MARERGGYDIILGLRVVHGRHLDNPRLTWMDKDGRLHQEQELSAEELIRRYEKERKPHT